MSGIDFGPHGKLEYNDNSTINVKTIAQASANYGGGVSGNFALTTAYGDGYLRIVHGIVGNADNDKALDVMTFVPQDISSACGKTDVYFNGRVKINSTDGEKFIGDLEGTADMALCDGDGKTISESYANCDKLCDVFDTLYNELK